MSEDSASSIPSVVADAGTEHDTASTSGVLRGAVAENLTLPPQVESEGVQVSHVWPPPHSQPHVLFQTDRKATL